MQQAVGFATRKFLAAQADEPEPTGGDDTGVAYLDWDVTNKTMVSALCDSATKVTGSDTTWSGGWYVVDSDVSIGGTVTVRMDGVGVGACTPRT